MSVRSGLRLYAAMLVIFAAAMGLVLKAGQGLHSQPSAAAVDAGFPEASSAAKSSAATLSGHFRENFQSPFGLLLVQILLIVSLAKAFGKAAPFFHQPPVMGEIIAGIVLGPSFFGWVLPGLHEQIFPAASFQSLRLLSQIGILIFMFLVGMDVDTAALRTRAHAAVTISHAGIVVPYFLGMLLSLYLYPRYAAAGTSFTCFALFMGIAMSITAFPVLARILDERGISATPMGTLAIACAATDDVSAWIILAAVVAVASSGTAGVLLAIAALSAAFTLFMLIPARRYLTRAYKEKKTFSHDDFMAAMLFLFASALITKLLGLHSLFGAFLAGVAISRLEGLKHFLAGRIQDFGVFLLPLFFAFTGLRTQIGLLSNPASWGACLLIMVTAIVGKLGGTSAAARKTGMSWKDSLAIGTLMNTRGLMELIVLNLGYDMGILSSEIFAMMVLMALATTLMTSPSLTLLSRFTGSEY
ncbi:MAG TPA: cation:proton antiporter [Verrucomicrobiae bacterium]|jgi:Kef-type K+ transport system membrane component KefB|nr:cation:proton antiporter [Verrucomicrobiae bacterium]